MRIVEDIEGEKIKIFLELKKEIGKWRRIIYIVAEKCCWLF